MEKVKKHIKQKMSDTQRVEFAKQIEMFYAANYVNVKKIFLMAILKGVGTGLGIFLGGTIVVALLLWLLSITGNIPFIGKISEAAQQSIQQTRDDSATSPQ